jgi:GNAT superfamily N-acetyltransferase
MKPATADAAGASAPFFRHAARADLPGIVRMLADDPLGATRERCEEPLPRCYEEGFDAIAADPNNALIVAELDGVLAGMLQITFIPSVTRMGSWRALVEGVRVARGVRGRGIGGALIAHAVERARERGCALVQLTTDKQRPDALRFYEGLGFRATHEGMKLHLPESQ